MTAIKLHTKEDVDTFGQEMNEKNCQPKRNLILLSPGLHFFLTNQICSAQRNTQTTQITQLSHHVRPNIFNFTFLRWRQKRKWHFLSFHFCQTIDQTTIDYFFAQDNETKRIFSLSSSSSSCLSFIIPELDACILSHAQTHAYVNMDIYLTREVTSALAHSLVRSQHQWQ